MLQERDLLWCKKLKKLTAGHYVVAVGALHLYGDNNLDRLFKQQID
ncbi:MAG TPA: TraB/GumN family protein [Arsenophonus sp.]